MTAMIGVYTVRAAWRGAFATAALLSLGCVVGEAAVSQPGATASDARTLAYNIGAEALGTALQEFAAQAGLQLLFSESDVAGMRTNGLRGSFTKEQALGQLLAGSPFNMILRWVI
jgi:hypothetical protein